VALLEVTGLVTEVSGFRILDNLDFSVDENELRVLLGPNGAGKTTLISLITGQFKPTAGRIRFGGQDITGWAPDDIFKAGISRKFQVPNMYETLSVYDNVMVSLKGGRKVFAYVFKKVSPRRTTASGRSSSSWIWRTRRTIPRTRCRTASGSGSRWACSSPPGRSSCSSTSPRPA
jgi:ABC-type uncharacterized transport system ATPase subunit